MLTDVGCCVAHAHSVQIHDIIPPPFNQQCQERQHIPSINNTSYNQVRSRYMLIFSDPPSHCSQSSLARAEGELEVLMLQMKKNRIVMMKFAPPRTFFAEAYNQRTALPNSITPPIGSSSLAECITCCNSVTQNRMNQRENRECLPSWWDAERACKATLFRQC
jgi:hypothetical protein